MTFPELSPERRGEFFLTFRTIVLTLSGSSLAFFPIVAKLPFWVSLLPGGLASKCLRYSRSSKLT